MICNVRKYPGVVEGYVTSGRASDAYYFNLDYLHARWKYLGKLAGGTFISAEAQGHEHIPEEFYMALDAAWADPNGHHEFEDPFETLEVQGS